LFVNKPIVEVVVLVVEHHEFTSVEYKFEEFDILLLHIMFGGQLHSVKHLPFEQELLIGIELTRHCSHAKHDSFVSFTLQQKQIGICVFLFIFKTHTFFPYCVSSLKTSVIYGI
jgi:hypothetical protein